MQDQNRLKFYHVIVKHEERYAIWPTEKALPTGWRSVGKQGKKAECLDYAKMVCRTGTCPLTPRKEIDAVSTPALMVVAEKTDPPGRLLVDGLSSREHQVAGDIRGDENVKALTLSRSFAWLLTWILAGQAARYFGSDFLGHHETCCGTIKMTTNKSHPNTETLRAIYADLSCIAECADDNVVLHTADRGVASQPS